MSFTSEEAIQNAIKWLELALSQLQGEEQNQSEQSQSSEGQSDSLPKMAWGAKVSPEFRKRVAWIADQLGCSPNWLMACMAWESGRTFSASIKNAAGSGAVGLIQFMPPVAKALGSTSEDLAAMTAEDQLKFVFEYFKPVTGKLKNLGDCYMTILWPAGIGKSDDYILFDREKRPTAYRENAGLDINHDNLVTRGECLTKIKAMLAQGLLPENAG